MRLTLTERLQVKKYMRRLIEARDTSYADYEATKEKVIATLKKQKASAFTKLADEWVAFSKLAEELSERKRLLNIDQQAAKKTEDELKDRIREKVISIFDDSEQAMSLAVHCLNSSFTVSKITAENLPKTVVKAGDIISTDYKQVVELLLEQNKDLQDTVNLLIKQCSTIASEDIVKAGDKRRTTIKVGESRLNEGWWESIVQVFNKISAKIKGYFSKLSKRRQKIDQYILLLKNK